MSETIRYSIGELAKEFDITNRSIRFYEEQGLLTPLREGQNRIYTKKDHVRLKLILRGKRLGFSLAETRTLFELYDRNNNSEEQLHTMQEMINEKRQTLQQQLSDIKILLEELNGLEKRCNDELNTFKNN